MSQAVASRDNNRRDFLSLFCHSFSFEKWLHLARLKSLFVFLRPLLSIILSLTLLSVDKMSFYKIEKSTEDEYSWENMIQQISILLRILFWGVTYCLAVPEREICKKWNIMTVIIEQGYVCLTKKRRRVGQTRSVRYIVTIYRNENHCGGSGRRSDKTGVGAIVHGLSRSTIVRDTHLRHLLIPTQLLVHSVLFHFRPPRSRILIRSLSCSSLRVPRSNYFFSIHISLN